MNELAILLASGFGVGLAYAAVPGAVNAEALRRGVRGGFRPAFLVQAGSILGDVFWALLGLTGAVMLYAHDAVAIGLGLIGAGFLFALARSALLDAVANRQPESTAERRGSSLMVGLIFGLANPAGLAFWAGIGSGMVLTSAQGAALHRLALFLICFAVGALVWGFGMAALVAWSRQFAGARLFRWINVFCAALLAYFGVRVLWSTLTRLNRLMPFLGRF